MLVLFSLFVSLPPLSAYDSARKLAPNYRHWLEVEVPYIISSNEKKEFLSLTSDAQRDSFIAAFWRVRNPDPNSETNTYKEEHYRRLQYANEHFGTLQYENGWRTAQGRIYIILGEPKQKATYHEGANIRPIEVWFYQGNSPALPPFFYILFYKRSAAEDWRIYSPTMDGPVALVSTGESQNDPKMALRFIRQGAGNEVAKVSCTLIPGEPCDFDHFEPTMESDMMLATINGLPDNPLTKATLNANRSREQVTTSIFTGDQKLNLNYVVFKDEENRQTLSYLASFARPEPNIIGSRPDGTFYYDLGLRTSVLTSDGKLAYEQEDQLTGKLTAAQAELAKKKIFAAEGRAPLAPGTYTLIATLTNNINHVAARQQASLTVPADHSSRIGISELVEYGSPAAVPDPQNHLPFSASKVRFTPRAVQIANLRTGDKLPIAFQLWLDPKTGDSSAAEKVHLRYVFGTVTASHDQPTVENEDIDAANRDKAGNLVSGHTIDTSTLEPGTYRLVVSATRDGSPQAAYAAMTIHVLPSDQFFEHWTAYGAVAQGEQALDDFKRGLAAEAQGADVEAEGFYSRALGENATDTRPLDRLAAIFDRRGQNDDLMKLSAEPALAKNAVDPQTLLILSRALNKSGNPKGTTRLLETQIKLQPPTVALYQALAEAWDAAGDATRARDFRALAANLKRE